MNSILETVVVFYQAIDVPNVLTKLNETIYLYGLNDIPIKNTAELQLEKVKSKNLSITPPLSDVEIMTVISMINYDQFTKREFPINHSTFFKNNQNTLLLGNLLPYKYYVLNLAYQTRFSLGKNSTIYIAKTEEEGNFFFRKL